MRTLLYATLIVGLAAPAWAQDLNLLGAASMHQKTQDEVDQETQRNRDYQEKLKQLPDQNVKRDPWGSMRGADPADQKQKQKQANPKKKPGAP